MSIPERLDDAAYLLADDRKEGSLLSVLVAISATSRRRYPKGTPSIENPKDKMRDREAFVTFLDAELERHKFMRASFAMDPPASPTPPLDQHDAFEEWHKRNLMPLSVVLYELCRCELCHEADVDPRVRFTEDSYLRHAPGRSPIQLSLPILYVTALSFIVTEAVENKGLFSEEAKALWPVEELGPLRTNFDHFKAFLESSNQKEV